MRVCGGTYRGARLNAPEGMDTRPTADKVREAFFGSVQFEIADCAFLDLFGGSGAMGIEAVSRGARRAVIVERDARAWAVITKNCDALKLRDTVQIVRQDAMQYIQDFSQREKFDMVYIDPPYAAELYAKILAELPKLLCDGARVVCESDIPLTEQQGYEIIKRKRYGKTHLTYFRRV